MDSAPEQRPRLALTLGDPAGIGPEIARAAITGGRVRAAATLVVLGPVRYAPPGVDVVAAEGVPDVTRDVDCVWVDTPAARDIPLGRPSREGGQAALAALRTGPTWPGRVRSTRS